MGGEWTSQMLDDNVGKTVSTDVGRFFFGKGWNGWTLYYWGGEKTDLRGVSYLELCQWLNEHDAEVGWLKSGE